MSRLAVKIECSEEETGKLKALTRGRRVERRLGERAQIILLCQDGLRNDEISEKLGVSAIMVAKWRRRFSTFRLKGLQDAVRSGKPSTYTEETRNKVLKVLEEAPPKGQSSWDGKAVALRLGISDDAVWRILRKEGIQLQRMRSWCVSYRQRVFGKISGYYRLIPEPTGNGDCIKCG